MKILFLAGCINQIGGIERVTLDLAHILKDSGHEIFIISYSKGIQEKQFDFLSEFDIRYLNAKPASIRYAFLKGKLLRQQLRTIQPDVVIYVDSLLYLFFRPFISKKYKQIVWEHFNYTVTFGTSLRTLSRKLAAWFADACVLLTKIDAEFWRKNCRCRANMAVIPNPVRNDVLKHSENLVPLLKRKKEVLCVGRLDYQKNIPALIDIWAEIEHDYPEWTLKIVGEGSERKIIEDKISNYGLENVELAGRVSDVSPFYADSQILVMTSRFEGLPLALIEGLFFGLPEIAYNCPMGPAEIISNEENGYVIEYENQQAFIVGIKKLLQDQNSRESFSQKSIYLSSKFTPQAVVKDWNHLFEKIL